MSSQPNLLQGCSQEERAKAILSRELGPSVQFVCSRDGRIALAQLIESLREFAPSRVRSAY